MSTTWHVPPPTLARFAADPAALDPVTASSVEAHLPACPTCRAVVAEATDPSTIARSWDGIADVIDRPRRLYAERILTRLGVPSTTARLLAATPALRFAGLAVLATMVAGAVAASRFAEADGPFLAVAPLIPLLATAAAFVPGSEPAGEAGRAAPVAGIGLVLRRAAVLLGLAFLALALGTVAVPVPPGDAVAIAWVLPAIALATGALALGTWVPVERAAAGLGLGWIATLAVLRLGRGAAAGLDDVAAFAPAGQAVALAATVVAVGLLAVRRDRLTALEVLR